MRGDRHTNICMYMQASLLERAACLGLTCSLSCYRSLALFCSKSKSLNGDLAMISDAALKLLQRCFCLCLLCSFAFCFSCQQYLALARCSSSLGLATHTHMQIYIDIHTFLVYMYVYVRYNEAPLHATIEAWTCNLCTHTLTHTYGQTCNYEIQQLL